MIYSYTILQGANALTGLAQYHNDKMEITFNYPANWLKPLTVDDESGYKYAYSCSITFNLMSKYNVTNGKNYIIDVRVNKLEVPPDFQDYNTCSCNALKDYVKWEYGRAFGDNDVLNDNQTKMAENHRAWRLEILNKDNAYKTYITWTINHDLGYRFIYSAPERKRFSDFLNDFNKFLNSVKFVAPTETISKKVSKTP